MMTTRNKILNRAERSWICASCGYVHIVKVKMCQQCVSKEIHYLQSRIELKRFYELHWLKKAGVLADIETRRRWKLDINGIHICNYVADFSWRDTETDELHVEDVKPRGRKDQLFEIKKKLMRICHGIDVEVVMR